MKRFRAILAPATLTLCLAITSCTPETYYTVTFEPNGGEMMSEAVISVAGGDRVFRPWAEREGYYLRGWYRDPGLIHEWNFGTDVVTADITLWAEWSQRRTITYHGNGGVFHDNDGVESWSVDYYTDGDKVMLPVNVIRPGYVLQGWYGDAALTDRWDFEGDVVRGDGELWAKWAPGIEGLTPDNYPRVDGATSTRALNMMIACKLLGLPYTWSWLSDTLERTVWQIDEQGFINKWLLGGKIQTSQTNGAMMNLIAGQTDIILRSTTASPDEAAAAQAAGVTLIQTPIALDAFVFLKNETNPVRSLTLDQIRKIYTKQITDWSQVGGDRAPMKVFTRPRNSGSEEALRELVMNGLEPAEFPEEQQVWSMAGLMWEMSREKYAIGYIFKNYKEMIVERYEPGFAIEGVEPTSATIRDRTYPLTTEVYAIIRSDSDRGSMGYKLYEWLLSSSSRGVLEECGFIPVN